MDRCVCLKIWETRNCGCADGRVTQWVTREKRFPTTIEWTISSRGRGISKYVARFGRGALKAYRGLQEELQVSGRRGTACEDAAAWANKEQAKQ